MSQRIRGLLRVVFGRTAFIVLFLLVQIGLLLGCFRWLSQYIFYVFGGFTLLSAGVIIYILNKKEDPNYKLAWIIPILLIPVFGTLFYIFVEINIETRLIAKRLSGILDDTKPYLLQEEFVTERLKGESESASHLAEYISAYGGYPAYDHTYAKYFPLGEDKFEELKIQLEQARKFIFMEYFIIERGYMWDSILDILERKAKEGVEVRVMYDGMCSLALLPYRYPRQLQARGIKCKMFSPIRPALSTYQNNRDHRKIVVIDNQTAFTGGVNLADEYINRKVRFGHWKDTAVMIKGKAVRSFTMMFLQMWNVTERGEEDYSKYLLDTDWESLKGFDTDGYVIPYGDSPLDNEAVGEHIYMDILYQAKHYVHIMTPYLILDNDMITALTYAAKRGVETIIIMPHIPDKIYAYLLARSYYAELIEAGVRIFEYTPGFVHAKVYCSDGEKATVGTINMDYRSLYLHFECAAYFYRNSVVKGVEADFMATLAKCREITLGDCRSYPLLKRVTGSVLRLFAPLM